MVRFIDTLARAALLIPIMVCFIDFALFSDYPKMVEGLIEIQDMEDIIPFNAFANCFCHVVGYEIGWAEGCDCHATLNMSELSFTFEGLNSCWCT